MSRATFGKREREQAKREKAQAKRDRRQAVAEDAGVPAAPAEGGRAAAEVLQEIEDIHRLYDEGRMTDDDFATRKAGLLGELSVD